MKTFMLSVLTDAIDPTTREQLQPAENKVTGGWKESGVLSSLFFRADNKGLFAVMHAESEKEVLELMDELPFHLYMHISAVELK